MAYHATFVMQLANRYFERDQVPDMEKAINAGRSVLQKRARRWKVAMEGKRLRRDETSDNESDWERMLERNRMTEEEMSRQEEVNVNGQEEKDEDDGPYTEIKLTVNAMPNPPALDEIITTLPSCFNDDAAIMNVPNTWITMNESADEDS
ncbi:hypothetical protein BYT27DRAFT_7262449 [Phlegmacium glaucopus]|nr:hypothetical protein BYT27DRAFT_7262449 [Phlegmacium glaucopus]